VTKKDDIAERVIATVADQIGGTCKISPRSRIEDDLYCTGDDAFQLMERMRREYQIDMTSFKFAQHFGGEGGAPLSYILPIPVALFVANSVYDLDWPWIAKLACVFGAYFQLVILQRHLPWERRRRERLALKRPEPVTVQHLIDAAISKTWPPQPLRVDTP
jgi:hypothetical protein